MPIQEGNRDAIYRYLIEFVKNNHDIAVIMYEGSHRGDKQIMSWLHGMEYSQRNDSSKYIIADDLHTIPINHQTGLCFGLIEFRHEEYGDALIVYKAEQFQIQKENGYDKVHEFCNTLNNIANNNLLQNNFTNTALNWAASLEPIQDINRDQIYNYLIDFSINHDWIGITLYRGDFGEGELISWKGLHSKEQELSRLQQLNINEHTGLSFQCINLGTKDYPRAIGYAHITYKNGQFKLIGHFLNCRFDRIRYLCNKLNDIRTDGYLAQLDSKTSIPIQQDKRTAIYCHLLKFVQNNSNIRITIRQSEDYDCNLTKESAIMIWHSSAVLEYMMEGDVRYYVMERAVNVNSMETWGINEQTGLCFKWIDLQQSGGRHETIEYDGQQFKISNAVGEPLSEQAYNLLARLNELCTGSELSQPNDSSSSSSSSSRQSSNISFFPPSSLSKQMSEEVDDNFYNIM